jgi:nucleoside-diphosphate-sugar epimerase
MILVTGAKGIVGKPLCDRLSLLNRDYLEVSRQTSSSSTQLQWNLSQAPSAAVQERLQHVESLIHCAPIWLLPAHLPLLGVLNVKRLVVFSSTSVLSKRDSRDQSEQNLVDQLRSSENSITEYCRQNNTQLFILRPTLIYGYGRDENVSRIANFIRRFGFMVLVGEASGLRQPVHADDLVHAAIACLTSEPANRQPYNVAGKDVISYRDMVKRIFIGLGRRPLIFSIPLWLFRPALMVAAKFTKFSYTPEMATRMNQDLNYDYAAAATDLDFAPQGFLEQPQRDLVS